MRDVLMMKLAKEPFKTKFKETVNATFIECNLYDDYWSVGGHLDKTDPTKLK